MEAAEARIELNEQALSEYDIFFVLDRSGSMGLGSKRFPGKTRWEEAEEMVQGLAAFCDKYDDDGLDLITFGADVTTDTGVTAATVHDIFSARQPGGSTNLAGALDTVVKMSNATSKNVIAIVVTDGVPNDEQEPKRIIERASNALTREEELTFLFLQIGDDRGAGKYLDALDDDLKCKYDIVDAVPAEVAETMNPIDLLRKAIND